LKRPLSGELQLLGELRKFNELRKVLIHNDLQGLELVHRASGVRVILF